jgi:uncharacterized membrane protein YfcA
VIVASSFLALVVGAVLGLLGGGGSILMLPVLVYVAGLSTSEGVTMSLLVVGTTSAAALIPHARARRIDWKVGLSFGVAGTAGALLGGFVSPHLPGGLLLAGFGALMVTTAVAMLRAGRGGPRPRSTLRVPLVLVNGGGVGFIAGLVGAGGGFLVVPALVLFGGLSVRVAIGTSLLVISMQSIAGFLTHLRDGSINAELALFVTLAAVSGSVLGARFSGRVSQLQLRRAFAWLVLALGSFMMIRESPGAIREGSIKEMTTWVAPLAGGTVIGLAGALLWLFNGRISGISGIAGGLSTAKRGERSWRVAFLLGLLTGGAALYRVFPEAFGVSASSLAMTVLAGALVGAGTTLANGCTSGHGVCGVSRLSRRSIVATVTFVGTGAISAYLFHHLSGAST